jgi:aspartyl protease family protein
VRGSLKTGLLIALIIGLIIAVTRRGDEVAGLNNPDLPYLVYLIGFLVLIGAGVLRMFRENFGEAVRSALIWVIVGLVLVVGYAYRFEFKEIGDRVMAEVVPGHAVAQGSTVEVVRASTGDFMITTEVNGVRIPMLLDTGATKVMLTRDAAIAAGLPMEMMRYTVNVETANGRAQAAAVTIDRLAVGGIVERSVPALIAQPGQLKVSLLGMSLLRRLRWEMRGDRVVMRSAD